MAAMLALVSLPNDAEAGVSDFFPLFSVTVATLDLEAHTPITRDLDVTFGAHVVAREVVTVPAGFGITDGRLIPDGDEVGSGRLEIDVDCDSTTEAYNFTVVNLVPEASDEWANWKAVGIPLAQLVMVVEEIPAPAGGYTITTSMFSGTFGPPLCIPMSYRVIHYGVSSSGVNVWTNPTSAGSFNWSNRVTSSPLAFPPDHEVTVSREVLIGPDADFDRVPDFADNCPADSNPLQTNTDVSLQAAGASVLGDSLGDVCDLDDDNDFYSDLLEIQVGTDTRDNCANGSFHNAFPPDLNNDAVTDGTDMVAVSGSFGLSRPPAPARHDVAPDPPDGFVDGTDLTSVANFFGQTCN